MKDKFINREKTIIYEDYLMFSQKLSSGDFKAERNKRIVYVCNDKSLISFASLTKKYI